MTLAIGNPTREAEEAVYAHGTDRHHLMDIVREVQAKFGYVPPDAIDAIAAQMGIHRVEVEGVTNFYHFLSTRPKGRTLISLTRGAVPSITGVDKVATAFEEELGIPFGEVTPDGSIGLQWTSCIGMCDQEPAALINGVVFTELTARKAKDIVDGLRRGVKPENLVTSLGDGKSSSELIHSAVNNNLRQTGAVIFDHHEIGSTVRKLVTMSPMETLNEIKKSNLRGRGGAGFPTGLKWHFCLRTPEKTRYIMCNADEGEPGTFKDRVILTEIPELVFEGMAVAAYVLGAREGILYLRGEYEYLRPYLENVLGEMREAGLLGLRIAGKEGFDFDIRIQMGAGAYICGEETALIESAEGKRGEPRDRPPYPVTAGYKGKPTAVNNVETLCCAARIIEKDADWFTKFGTENSAGTKLISVSGDVKEPGVYEIPFGTSLADLLSRAGADSPQTVQIGGPSGTCIVPEDFGRKIAYEDLATGGAIIVIGPDRDLLRIVRDFVHFFQEEACGRCTPCRVGNTIMLHKLDKILGGRGTMSDLRLIRSLGRTIRCMSRCGLGQTAPNPVLSTLENFLGLYTDRITAEDFVSDVDFNRALK
jgi:[NiFe] hydrogenase diaphorase moiety large subunit